MAYYHSPSQQQDLITSLLAYLIAYPGAKDSLHGIRTSWLAGMDTPPRLDQIQTALEELVDQGLILVSQPRGSARLYRLNLHRLPEVKTILQVPLAED